MQVTKPVAANLGAAISGAIDAISDAFTSAGDTLIAIAAAGLLQNGRKRIGHPDRRRVRRSMRDFPASDSLLSLPEHVSASLGGLADVTLLIAGISQE